MKKGIILLVVSLLFLLIIVPINAFGENNYKVMTYIDYPKNSVESNKIYIQGWVMSEVQNDIKIYIDSNEVPNVERYQRNDVIRAITGYGNATTNPTPGYKVEYDASKIMDGTHILKIIVYEKNTTNQIKVDTKSISLKKHKITSYIDNPLDNALGETIKINGWVMSTNNNNSIEIQIDGNNVGNVERYQRNDVLKAITGYGDITTNPLPGYLAFYNASNLNDGKHFLKVTIKDANTNEILQTKEKQFNLKKYKTKTHIYYPKYS